MSSVDSCDMNAAKIHLLAIERRPSSNGPRYYVQKMTGSTFPTVLGTKTEF